MYGHPYMVKKWAKAMKPKCPPPHLRGPIVQAYADTNGVKPAQVYPTKKEWESVYSK